MGEPEKVQSDLGLKIVQNDEIFGSDCRYEEAARDVLDLITARKRDSEKADVLACIIGTGKKDA